jgi:L-ascorbate metabolism protein UlaG (beta-lactamase superfamily)
LYITGDTMLVDSLEDIARRYPDIDLGLIHTGGTTFLVTVVTMTAEHGVKAVEITKPRTAIPIHYNDFSVFLSGLDDFKKAADASSTSTKFVYLAHGETYIHFKPTCERGGVLARQAGEQRKALLGW